jgi:hypothetical protein
MRTVKFNDRLADNTKDSMEQETLTIKRSAKLKRRKPTPTASTPASGSDAACADCKFFELSRTNEFTGICRRYPPTVKDRFGVDCWPIVGREAWCGEYKHQNHD